MGLGIGSSRIAKHTPGGVEHDQTEHGNWSEGTAPSGVNLQGYNSPGNVTTTNSATVSGLGIKAVSPFATTPRPDSNPRIRSEPETDHLYVRAQELMETEAWDADPKNSSEAKEIDALFAESRRLKTEWVQDMEDAITLGEISPEDAKSQYGYRPQNVTSHNWQPLPETVFHVTTAGTSIRENGILSREEVRALEGDTEGLGGGASDTISLTGDPEIAYDIHNAMLELHDVTNDKITFDQMRTAAKTGNVGSLVEGSEPKTGKPFWEGWLGKKDQKVVDEIENGTNHWREYGKPHTKPEAIARITERDPGATNIQPAGEATGRDKNVWYDWTYKRGPKARREQVVDAFKGFLAYRESTGGGPTDPLFWGFGADEAERYAASPRSEIQLLTFKPTSDKIMGQKMGALDEYRVTTGEALTLVEDADTRVAKRLGISKHYGPGPHKSGSSQNVHGKKGSGSAGHDSTPTDWDNLAERLADEDMQRISGEVRALGPMRETTPSSMRGMSIGFSDDYEFSLDRDFMVYGRQVTLRSTHGSHVELSEFPPDMANAIKAVPDEIWDAANNPKLVVVTDSISLAHALSPTSSEMIEGSGLYILPTDEPYYRFTPDGEHVVYISMLDDKVARWRKGSSGEYLPPEWRPHTPKALKDNLIHELGHAVTMPGMMGDDPMSRARVGMARLYTSDLINNTKEHTLDELTAHFAEEKLITDDPWLYPKVTPGIQEREVVAEAFMYMATGNRSVVDEADDIVHSKGSAFLFDMTDWLDGMFDSGKVPIAKRKMSMGFQGTCGTATLYTSGVAKHYPGGKDHDQSKHGVRGNGDATQVDDDYRGQHQPSAIYGAPGHDLSVLVNEDIYEHPEWYFSMTEPYNREGALIVQGLRGNPDAVVEVFRAVPAGVETINDGDWVTTSRNYAVVHGDASLQDWESTPVGDPLTSNDYDWKRIGPGYEVLSRFVTAKELVWPADSMVEFGWFPNGPFAKNPDATLEDLEDADIEKFQKHYPGGKDHDQKNHGRRGTVSRRIHADQPNLFVDQPRLGDPAPTPATPRTPKPTGSSVTIPNRYLFGIKDHDSDGFYIGMLTNNDEVDKVKADIARDPVGSLKALGKHYRWLGTKATKPDGVRTWRLNDQGDPFNYELDITVDLMKNAAEKSEPLLIERGKEIRGEIESEYSSRGGASGTAAGVGAKPPNSTRSSDMGLYRNYIGQFHPENLDEVVAAEKAGDEAQLKFDKANKVYRYYGAVNQGMETTRQRERESGTTSRFDEHIALSRDLFTPASLELHDQRAAVRESILNHPILGKKGLDLTRSKRIEVTAEDNFLYTENLEGVSLPGEGYRRWRKAEPGDIAVGEPLVGRFYYQPPVAYHKDLKLRRNSSVYDEGMIPSTLIDKNPDVAAGELVAMGTGEIVVKKRIYSDLLYTEAKRLSDSAYRQEKKAIASLEHVHAELKQEGGREQAVIDTLSKHREMGGEIDVRGSGKTKAARQLQLAADAYPAEWVERSNDAGPLRVRGKPGSRAYYYNQSQHMSRRSKTKPRTWTTESRITVNPNGILTDDTLHELGHRMEHVIPEVRFVERSFWNRRTQGEPWQLLRRLTGNSNYKSEKAKPDKFGVPYMGKQYGVPSREYLHAGDGFLSSDEAYELITTAYPVITGRSKNKLDPEHEALILGILAEL